MKKIYYCLVALLLITHTTHPGHSLFKSQESPGITWLITAATGGLVVGVIGTWKLASHYYAASQEQMKKWVANEVANATKTLEETTLKELKEGQDTITDRLDHLGDVTGKHTLRLQRYKARLNEINRPPETDPLRAAYIVRQSPRPRSNSMPPLTPRSDANNDENDTFGDFSHLLTRKYVPQISAAQNAVDDYSADDEELSQNLSASAPVQRTQSNVALLPSLSFKSANNDTDEDCDDNYCFTQDSLATPPSTRTGGLTRDEFSLLRQSQSEPSLPKPLSPRGIADEHGKTVYDDTNVIAGRRSRG